MATKETKKVAAVTTAPRAKVDAMARAREARDSRADLDTFEAVADQPSDKKLPPQAQAIVNILIASGPTKRSDLTKSMEAVVTTRQPMGRILTYYQKRLEQEGYVTITKAPPSSKRAEAPPEDPSMTDEPLED